MFNKSYLFPLTCSSSVITSWVFSGTTDLFIEFWNSIAFFDIVFATSTIKQLKLQIMARQQPVHALVKTIRTVGVASDNFNLIFV